MHTRNTVTTLRSTHLKRLDGALLILDILSDPISSNIIDYLQKRDSATQLDLLIHSGAGFNELEKALEMLCFAQVIQHRSDLFSSNYRLNKGRMEQILHSLLSFSLA